MVVALGINADGEIVERDFEYTTRCFRGIVRVVRQRLRIGEEQELTMRVLQLDAVLERANVVPQMERTRRAITGENGL